MNFFKHKSTPIFLYKYMSQDGAQSLFNSDAPSIWFSEPSTFNDPFDLNSAGSSIKNGADGITVLCLCETPISIPMWAHYGQGNIVNTVTKESFIHHGGGVVLEFSTSSEFFKKYVPMQVIYRSKRPTVKSRPYDVLLSKSKEWSYEREWRCFTTVWDEQHTSGRTPVAIPFPFQALTKIIHGYDSQVSTDTFLARPETCHVEELVCRLDPWNYHLNLHEMSDISYIKENYDAAIWGTRNKRK